MYCVELPAVNFGNDIEFNAPEKPFVAPAAASQPEQQEGDTIPEPLSDRASVPAPAPPPQQQQQTAAASAGTAAIYDRNWLLQ